MRVKGWIRVGVVLSVIWAVGAGFYQNNEELSRSDKFFQFAYDVCQRGKEARSKPANLDCFEQSWAAAKPFRDPRLGDVLFMAFAPLPVFWLAAFLAVLIFRWVRRGFTN
jgi:hypothetical protein